MPQKILKNMQQKKIEEILKVVAIIMVSVTKNLNYLFDFFLKKIEFGFLFLVMGSNALVIF